MLKSCCGAPEILLDCWDTALVQLGEELSARHVLEGAQVPHVRKRLWEKFIYHKQPREARVPIQPGVLDDKPQKRDAVFGSAADDHHGLSRWVRRKGQGRVHCQHGQGREAGRYRSGGEQLALSGIVWSFHTFRFSALSLSRGARAISTSTSFGVVGRRQDFVGGAGSDLMWGTVHSPVVIDRCAEKCAARADSPRGQQRLLMLRFRHQEQHDGERRGF